MRVYQNENSNVTANRLSFAALYLTAQGAEAQEYRAEVCLEGTGKSHFPISTHAGSHSILFPFYIMKPDKEFAAQLKIALEKSGTTKTQAAKDIGLTTIDGYIDPDAVRWWRDTIFNKVQKYYISLVAQLHKDGISIDDLSLPVDNIEIPKNAQTLTLSDIWKIWPKLASSAYPDELRVSMGECEPSSYNKGRLLVLCPSEYHKGILEKHGFSVRGILRKSFAFA